MVLLMKPRIARRRSTTGVGGSPAGPLVRSSRKVGWPRRREAAVAALESGSRTRAKREVIVAHHWGGLSFEQIALVVGCSASTAFRRYTAGVEDLRKQLGVKCPNRSSND